MTAPRAATVLCCFLLLAAGCAASPDSPRDTAEGTTSQAVEPAPTMPAGDGGVNQTSPRDAPNREVPKRDVPELELPRGPVGSQEKYDELIEGLAPFITEEQGAAGVPWPDLRNPDPIAAYRDTATFQQWMMQNNPRPALTEAYTAPGSPERDFDLQMFDTMHRLNVRSTRGDPPYSMRVEAVVHPAATSITDALLAQVPEGSAAVVYFDSGGERELITESGIVVDRIDGWSDLGPWVAIMEPTEVGWQVWWDELTDPQPLGQDDDRGRASEQQNRTKT